MRVRVLLLVAGLAGAGWGQLPPMPMGDASAATVPGQKPLTYDVVSVKVNKVGDGRMSWQMTDDGMKMIGIEMKNLLMSAYGLFGSPEDEITGLPKWAESVRFDVEAKVAPEDVARYKKMTSKEAQALMQSLLVERFGLKATPVTNERAVYGLVVAKAGPKMTASKISVGEDGKSKMGGSTRTQRGGIQVTEGTMGDLAGMLTHQVDKTVVDKTGLTGKYDYTLTWTPDNVADANADNGKVAAPPLFTALQEELGLRLEPMRGPVKGLVVERLEMPTAN